MGITSAITPTDEEMRRLNNNPGCDCDGCAETLARYDRWLAAHDARTSETALASVSILEMVSVMEAAESQWAFEAEMSRTSRAYLDPGDKTEFVARAVRGALIQQAAKDGADA